jgi:hypothetical protein
MAAEHRSLSSLARTFMESAWALSDMDASATPSPARRGHFGFDMQIAYWN